MNRPKRTRLIVVIIIIMGRFNQAVQDEDTDFCSMAQMALSCAAITDKDVYETPANAWSMEQADVDAMATAFCDACENGEWPLNIELITERKIGVIVLNGEAIRIGEGAELNFALHRLKNFWHILDDDLPPNIRLTVSTITGITKLEMFDGLHGLNKIATDAQWNLDV